MDGGKIAKFVIVFSLESFPLYGIHLHSQHTLARHTECARCMLDLKNPNRTSRLNRKDMQNTRVQLLHVHNKYA